MVTEIWINIGSGNGLLPDGTKPLPEPIGWFFIYDFLWHSPESNFTANTHATYTILYNEFGMHACTSKITANELKSIEHVEPILTLNVRGPSYLGLTRSISWLLKPWLLTSPGHQQPWYRLYRICRSLSYMRKDFKDLCHINVEEWHKM